ncbi:MAG: hypothetical protein ACKVP0_28320 [Pirellulaceae bacterium]
MDPNPYSPPKDIEQKHHRSLLERLMILVAAALTGCLCGAVAHFAIGFLVYFLSVILWNGSLSDVLGEVGLFASWLLGLFVMVIASFFAHRRFSRPKKSATQTIVEELPNT